MAVIFERMGLAPSYVDYEVALARQVELLQEVAALKRQNTVLLLEHQAVFTAGKLTEDHEYPTDSSIPVVKTDRGGKLTWHGPGQLTGYPILRLPLPFDVVKYVRILEEIIINVVAHFGIKGERVEGRSGVWVLGDGISADKKIAAIGIRVSQRTTMHGFALNCSNETNPFGMFIPCGITDAGVTTISEQVGRTVTPEEVLPLVEAEFEKYAHQLALDFEPGDSPGDHGFTR
ncbi:MULTISPECIES: lipoyl(octanoyl) transferase LipB [unclassified Rothia (in: high G+C Gram-positive bacteria)]|uniref:lipoyl(octanoyl) transferase LipB n=1 Tax=unclassified Rothia (in: high G+C Gram-positive bacteria) TaxID=2689056 RepID=UPI00195CC679|nr:MULTISPECIES: lipoyl(octanoyl) transferase LipB [unclassified Rothia (in: high G+C Gram-positive bacteria)]MBM7050724.1 lipoyl(octanoyl) transferase LipB [Rothia sp. ZJ1223]QRZ60909.1 lipoyl(octanoyl) transferase LipB [Rothia sp. ZJ932]